MLFASNSDFVTSIRNFLSPPLPRASLLLALPEARPLVFEFPDRLPLIRSFQPLHATLRRFRRFVARRCKLTFNLVDLAC